MRIDNFLILVPLSLLLLVACSADRKNIISKTYHNTTARYNAYFYAKQRIEEIESIVNDSYDNDYNNVLKIYPDIDSVLAASYQTEFEDCIKKASIAIQRHKNSKWVDDSYILIGRARFYDVDYVNAIETYRYVNTNSEDDDAKHEALARLLRTYTDAGEYSNAVAVSDYLKKEKLNKDNQKILYINKAHYYQVQEDVDNMVQNLVKAAPLLTKKDGKGRMYFIIGQVYQELGFDAEAYNYYKKCIASNPVYELDFYARLYMAQVTELNKSSDVRAARKLFRKLLSDKKNEEFRDKIYYEMAEFELKRNNLEKALGYYDNSVQASINNNRQKGQSYLKLGIIYYDSLREYETAKAYYDSTISALPEDYEDYAQIKERQEILDKFVEHLNTINLQDSLLALSEMDTALLRAKVEGIVKAEEEQKKIEEEKERKRVARQNFALSREDTGIGSSTGWYFGNPSAVALGQTEFRRMWGDRPLEDNWRRINKGAVQDFDQELENPGVAVTKDNESNTVQEQGAAEGGPNRVNQLLAQIPKTEEAKQQSLGLLEDAYYNLGKIYNFDLEEKDNAALTFETLLQRFPETEYEAEVLYELYLIYKNLASPEQERIKEQLLAKYPNTTYAKLLANPNYTAESTEANEKQKQEYKTAYNYYINGEYDTAEQQINNALNKYQETIFTPHLKLLKILIIGKTEDINLYQYELGEFIKKNPDSDITPYARTLLEASKNFLEKQRKLLGTQYVEYFEQEHHFVLLYEANERLAENLPREIENFNTGLGNANLNIANLVLDEQYAMIMVSGLEDKPQAENYYNRFVQSNILDSYDTSKLHKFVINKDNFTIFYQSKDWGTYMKFFNKHYRNEL